MLPHPPTPPHPFAVCVCVCAVGCQELLHRTSLENQKLSLMGEVSYLKVKLADMEGKQSHGAERQHKAEVRGGGLLHTDTFLL